MMWYYLFNRIIKTKIKKILLSIESAAEDSE